MNTIGTFWIGPRLPGFHRMCVASWLAQGYRVEFFSYAPVANVPEGCEVRDAGEVLDRTILIEGAPELDEPGRANWRADLFRLAMLKAGGRVWCDADYLMLRPLPEFETLLLGREQSGRLCNAVLWLPPEHPVLNAVLEAFVRRSMPPWSNAKARFRRLRTRLSGRPASLKDYPLHHWGRNALTHFIERSPEREAVLDHHAFYYPVVYDYRLFEAATPFEEILADPRIHGLHFFKKSEERFESAEPGSFIDWAKSRFLTEAA